MNENNNYSKDLIYKSIIDVNLVYLGLLKSYSAKYKLYGLVNEAPKWTELRLYFLNKNPFIKIFISSYIGHSKPEKESYAYFLRDTKYESNEVLFIDDDIRNIETANDLGFETILYKNNQQAFKEIESKLQR
jgi:FMN phosphatase YigB (HAD superfamily)